VVTFTGCQPEEKITHEKHRRVNDMPRLLAAILPEGPFVFRVPDGWARVPPTSGFYVLSFAAGDEDKRVDIDVSMFRGEGGGVLANVNRWRDQIKLPPLTSDQIGSLPETVIGNAKGKFVDITGPEAPPEANRIMGAVLMRNNSSLFFKMMGPSASVSRQQSAFEAFLKSFEVQDIWIFKIIGTESDIDGLTESFDQFLASIQFADHDKPTWTLPQGWTQDKDKTKQTHYATIHTGPGANAAEMTVTVRPSEQAVPLKDLVNSWRSELGVKGLDMLDLEDFFRHWSIAGRPAVIVDMIGPTSLKAREESRPLAQGAPFKFDTPSGWTQIPATSTFYVLSFMAADKDKKAAINVSIMAGDGGGLAANVNRWRGQVGLNPVTAAEINALPEVQIGTAKGKLIDVAGNSAPPQSNRILGAILIRQTDSLFFKMTGPKEFVGQQQPAFESFLKSIQFDG
jgi:hypothetical protein